VVGCGSGARSGVPDARPTPPADFLYRALTHVSFWHDGYLGSEAESARRLLAPSTGATWAGVLVTWYMDGRRSPALGPDPLRTPSDDAVVAAIRDLHALGLNVMLKPHVDVKDGSWRGTIAPADTDAWFSSYDAFLARCADLAEAHGVEMLDVGTELATMSDARFAPVWAALIARVRSRYRGPLTYSASANAPGDEFTSVAFWGLLDVAGLDVYVPLTGRDDPTRDELVSAWTDNVNGHDMVAAYRNWQGSLGMPVVFTEIGYRSVSGTNRAPYDLTFQGPEDPQEQADCFEAAFTVWARESAWMKGVFVWNWPATTPPPGDTDYTPRGKPAEAVLRKWMSGP
jgi:hypothetical protein